MDKLMDKWPDRYAWVPYVFSLATSPLEAAWPSVCRAVLSPTPNSNWDIPGDDIYSQEKNRTWWGVVQCDIPEEAVRRFVALLSGEFQKHEMGGEIPEPRVLCFPFGACYVRFEKYLLNVPIRYGHRDMRENLNILFSAPHLPCVIDLEYSWKNEETPEIEEGGAVESLGLSSEIDQSWDTYATEIASSLGPQGYFEPWLVNLRGGANDENEITEMDEISIRALSYPYVVLNLARIANSFKQNASRWQPPVD